MTESHYTPRSAALKEITVLTPREKLFTVEFDDGIPLGHKPGQFVEVFVPGIGEAPISISSPPGEGDLTFEMCIRAVGDVTKALHRLSVGDKIGVRGPYGNGFDAELFKGKDLIFVAGGLGIAPLRSLFLNILENKEEYGKVTLLYGCKDPLQMLFCDELRSCTMEGEIVTKLTVDSCPEGMEWEGDVGLVTKLIDEMDIDPEGTYSVICGPPIMYKFVVASLEKKGISHDNMIMTLERRMKCGIGKCGHCQINGLYTCLDGPVFSYSQLKNLEEAL